MHSYLAEKAGMEWKQSFTNITLTLDGSVASITLANLLQGKQIFVS